MNNYLYHLSFLFNEENDVEKKENILNEKF